MNMTILTERMTSGSSLQHPRNSYRPWVGKYRGQNCSSPTECPVLQESVQYSLMGQSHQKSSGVFITEFDYKDAISLEDCSLFHRKLVAKRHDSAFSVFQAALMSSKCWVPGHVEIEVNEIADELPRKGSVAPGGKQGVLNTDECIQEPNR
uniref:Uncharacterized protein n=1 Tax=Megaselia scalaris TaxID=36166 RepID=T1GLM1_MEGSC